MGSFEYDALTAAGRQMAGTIEADSADAARQALEEMRLTVNSIRRAPLRLPRMAIGRNEFILFNQQLAAIAKAGVPLERALRELARDVSSSATRRLIQEIAGELESGTPIVAAFERRKDRFPPLYGHIVEAGVRSGRLGEMLISLNRHLAMADQTRRILWEALCYPVILVALGAVLVTAVLVGVVPQFDDLFLGLDRQVPWSTTALMWASRHVVQIWIGVGTGILGIVLLAVGASTVSWGRRLTERLVMGLPAFGRISHRASVSRLADAMALLIGAGVDMPTCVRLAGAAAGGEALRADCESLARRIEQGDGIAVAGESCTVIPRLFIYSAQVGAQRDDLADTLYGLSDMYAEQARAQQARLQAVLLPLLIVLVGCLFGFFVVGIFRPLVGLLQGDSLQG